MQPTAYYARLGVAPTATAREIKGAFRRCVLSCHPDLYPHDPTATARFRAVKEAAETLLDPQRRACYDSPGPVQDSDVAYQAPITPSEALTGTRRVLRFHAPDGRIYDMEVYIPGGIVAGSRLRIPGAGRPGPTGRRGDLYLEIVVN